MADVFTPRISFGPWSEGLLTPDAPGKPYVTIRGGTPTPSGPAFAAMPALTAAMAAGQPAVILMVGDSTTIGFGAMGSSDFSNMPDNNVTAALTANLTLKGFNVSFDTFGFGDRNLANSPAILTAMYSASRMTMDNGWTYFGGNPNPYGSGLFGANGNNAPITCQARLPWDKAEIFYRQVPGFGDLSVDRGGAAQTVPTAGALDDIKSAVLTFPLGTSPAVVRAPSGFVTPLSLRLWNSATPNLVLIDNCGIGGYPTAAWKDASSGMAPFPGLQKLRAHAMLINLGLNDKNTGVASATFQSNLIDIANQCKAAVAPGIALPPDVVLAITNSCLSGYPADFDATWKAAVAAAATATSTRTPMNLYAIHDPHSAYLMRYGDQLHALKIGYDDLGNGWGNFL